MCLSLTLYQTMSHLNVKHSTRHQGFSPSSLGLPSLSSHRCLQTTQCIIGNHPCFESPDPCLPSQCVRVRACMRACVCVHECMHASVCLEFTIRRSCLCEYMINGFVFFGSCTFQTQLFPPVLNTHWNGPSSHWTNRKQWKFGHAQQSAPKHLTPPPPPHRISSLVKD